MSLEGWTSRGEKKDATPPSLRAESGRARKIFVESGGGSSKGGGKYLSRFRTGQRNGRGDLDG